MLCVWWNYEGIIHFVPGSRTIYANLYSEQLDRMYAIVRQEYPALVNRKRALLQQDNVRPHIARTTGNKYQELEGTELVPHPAYSPDLAPSDYYLFRSTVHFLRLRRFTNQKEVEASVGELFTSKDKNWYQCGIKELAKRWLQTVPYDDLYNECSAAFVVT
ncbi:histone-lysine N-methyltransferase SETMAR-like [Octopus sinensis]|uniref:Histone-lysine N-methyltransferase SETMAR-like n=1 Tax=Octopus sinensis TaxID=2607531 RepID=A0A6P7SNX1_9MOLL|nr:histone-lysine N-methyltransferase SETMAR-like [Octopus sinensis]